VQVDKSKILSIDHTYKSIYSGLEEVEPDNWNLYLIQAAAHRMDIFTVIQDKNSCLYLDTAFIQFIEPDVIDVLCVKEICVNSSPLKLQTGLGGNWESLNYPL